MSKASEEKARRDGHREMRAAVLRLLEDPRSVSRVEWLRDSVAQLEPVAGYGQVAELPDRQSVWFQTHSNLAYLLLDPDPTLITLEDIAHSLALQCRYNGHVPSFYSVAQHSELVAECLMESTGWHWRTHRADDPADVAKQAIVRWGALHDGAEAYTGDLIRPIKKLLPDFARLFEEPTERALATRFALPWPIPAEVKVADLRVLAAERKFLRPPPPRPLNADENVEPWPTTRFVPLPPERAEASYLDLCRRLFGIGEAKR